MRELPVFDATVWSGGAEISIPPEYDWHLHDGTLVRLVGIGAGHVYRVNGEPKRTGDQVCLNLQRWPEQP